MRTIIYILMIFTSGIAFAFKVEPMMADLQPLGGSSQVTLRVTNTSEQPLSVAISSFDLLINSQGKEELLANEDDFLIIPMTAVIAPGKSQAVLVKYIGEPLLDESKSYRVEVKQLAINFNTDTQAAIGIGYVFQTLYNVVPNQAKAQLVVKSKQQAAEGVWKVRLSNTGNKYIRLTKTQWVIEGPKDKLVLEGKALGDALTGKFLMPNSSREVSLQLPSQFDAELSKLTVVHE
jgi:fimbrial chaperone protein